MNAPPHRQFRRTMAAAALTAALAGAMAGPAVAAPRVAPLIEPTIVGTFGSDTWTLFNHPHALLRADGSFGYFTARGAQPHEQLPLELITYGGPVPAGQFRIQGIYGAPGGTLPFPDATASGVEGYDWVFDDAEWRHARPGEQSETLEGWVASEPFLLALDDRGIVARRVPLDFGPHTATAALVPSGAGLRVIVGANDRGMDVRRADGTLLAHVPQLWPLRSAVGLREGSVLLGGWADRPGFKGWTDNLVEVSDSGKVTRVRTKSGALVHGDPLTTIRGGVLLAERPHIPARAIAVLSDSGRLTNKRTLSHLRLPWSEHCQRSMTRALLSFATVGPDGNPVIGVKCIRPDHRGSYDTLDELTVGLDGQLRARWATRAGTTPRIGPDGRLYATQMQRQYRDPNGVLQTGPVLLAWRVPESPGPRRGHVVSVRKDGPGAVATIRCNAGEGTVCSGTARLTRGGSSAVTLPYAMSGRPGKQAAVIRRHFDVAPAGAGRLQVKLTN